MDPRETGRGYDQLAEKWQGSNLQKNGIAQCERAIQFSKKRGAALDVGCGSNGRFLDLLLMHDFEPEGVDVSARMIALARQRHPGISFYEADIAQWKFARKYDFILAWDSIWHLPLEQQEPVLKKICEGLEPQGIFIFSAGGLDGPDEHTNSFMGPLMNHSTLGIPKFLELLTKFGCGCRHLEYDQYPEPHIYFIAQKI
jgi:SAM-dependent methyltransferase